MLLLLCCVCAKLKDHPRCVSCSAGRYSLTAVATQQFYVRSQDFMRMLPMPEYTHPQGTLNMVSYLEDKDVRPDLGPKGYVAMGRWAARAAPRLACIHVGTCKAALACP